MNGKLRVLAILAVATLLLVAAGVAQADPGTLYVDAADPTCGGNSPCYSSIQDAINAAAAGDTIMVAAGLYSPAATITVNKSVTIQGPQAGIDPRPSAGSARTPGDTSSEAIIDGSPATLGRIFYIDANNVVIDGLVIRAGTADMIRQSNSRSGTQVRYNIIHDGRGDEGVQLANCTSCAIDYN